MSIPKEFQIGDRFILSLNCSASRRIRKFMKKILVKSRLKGTNVPNYEGIEESIVAKLNLDHREDESKSRSSRLSS